jgi:hypothetical protein
MAAGRTTAAVVVEEEIPGVMAEEEMVVVVAVLPREEKPLNLKLKLDKGTTGGEILGRVRIRSDDGICNYTPTENTWTVPLERVPAIHAFLLSFRRIEVLTSRLHWCKPIHLMKPEIL